MNQLASAARLLTRFRRHRAVIHPRTAQLAYHWAKGTLDLPYAPLKMHVEPTNRCNLRCIMCPQSIDAAGDDAGFMDVDLYRRIIDRAKGRVREINLFLRGESMLHRRIFDMVRVTEEAGIVSHLNTNGTILTEEHSAGLLDAGLSKLTVSFDSGVPEVYEEMRRGARFNRTLRNVLTLLHEKLRRGAAKPYVIMQVMQLYGGDPAAEPEIPGDFVRRFEGLPVDEWDTLWAHGWAGTMGDGEPYSAAPRGPHYHPCNWLWKSMAVYWDGTVPACCADFGGEQIVGNLNENTLMEIWNGPAMRAIRESQVRGRLEDYPLCRTCDALWQEDGLAWKAFAKARSLVTSRPLPQPEFLEQSS